jgi:hypothetical protein
MGGPRQRYASGILVREVRRSVDSFATALLNNRLSI